MGIGMSWSEHTPPNYTMREDPAEPLVSQNLQEPITAPQETPQENECPPAKTLHVRELHLYTVPNREYSGHYPNSPLFHDIQNNPALYVDHADF